MNSCSRRKKQKRHPKSISSSNLGIYLAPTNGLGGAFSCWASPLDPSSALFRGLPRGTQTGPRWPTPSIWHTPKLCLLWPCPWYYCRRSCVWKASPWCASCSTPNSSTSSLRYPSGPIWSTIPFCCNSSSLALTTPTTSFGPGIRSLFRTPSSACFWGSWWFSSSKFLSPSYRRNGCSTSSRRRNTQNLCQ